MGTSKERDGLFGKYTEHFDDNGKKIGESRERTGIFSNYTEHTDSSGKKTGESRERTGIFANYTEHTDSSGKKTGESRERTGIFADYTEHTDSSGRKTGESRKRDGVFNEYTNHTGDGRRIEWSHRSGAMDEKGDEHSAPNNEARTNHYSESSTGRWAAPAHASHSSLPTRFLFFAGVAVFACVVIIRGQSQSDSIRTTRVVPTMQPQGEQLSIRSRNNASHIQQDSAQEIESNQGRTVSELRLLSGTWHGSQNCTSGKRSLELILAIDSNEHAYGAFSYHPSSQILDDTANKSTFLLDVSYAHSGLSALRGRGEIGKLQLSPASWTDQPTKVSLRGSVFLSNRKILGQTNDPSCGGFQLTYTGPQGVDELLRLAHSHRNGKPLLDLRGNAQIQPESIGRPTLSICNNTPSLYIFVAIATTTSRRSTPTDAQEWEANGWYAVEQKRCLSYLLPKHYRLGNQDVLLYAYNNGRREWADEDGETICVRNSRGTSDRQWRFRWIGSNPLCPSIGHREARSYRFMPESSGSEWSFNTESIGEVPWALTQQ